MARADNQKQVGHKTKLTPTELAKMWGVGRRKVIGWIRSGELPAINAASSLSVRASYLIDIADVSAFEKQRTVVAASNAKPRTRRSWRDEGLVSYMRRDKSGKL